MATIVDSTELPPVHFPVFTSVDITNNAVSVAVENCQLCGGSKRSFYCKNCVRSGEIVRSKNPSKMTIYGSHLSPHKETSPLQQTTETCSERYKEKLKKWDIRLIQRKELEDRCKLFSQHKVLLAEKKSELSLAHQRNETLKEAIKQANLLLRQDKGNLTKLQEENKTRRSKTQKREEKKKRIQYYIEKSKRHTESASSEVELCSQRLKEIRHQHAQNLVHCIFPISEILPKSYTDNTEENTVDLLAEARHTSYVKGRWVYVGHGSELKYGIVHPTLPGNGDYSAYHLWSNKEESVGPETRHQQRNPANNIGAALQFTAQMTTVLSYLLDVNLPYRVWYSDFGEDLAEDKFQSLVFKLNSNIIHLCCSQNVLVEDLSPTHSLQNILSLLRATEIGRMGTFQVSDSLMQSFEESCPTGLTESDYSEHDDELDGADVEWEQVSGSLPEAEIPSFYSSTQVSNRGSESISASQSLTGGLKAAMTSWWSGWGVPAKPSSPR